MKRKADQGSIQLQGEVQELAIEKILRDLFPLDEIEEVAKGQKGADALQLVNDRMGRNCGRIIYESKRTKTFNPHWIEKLKLDQQRENAQVGIIVTDRMPDGMTSFGYVDSICICTFSTLPIVASLIREKLVDVYCAKEVNMNKTDKMAFLFEFLTSTEFRLQIEGVLDAIQSLRAGIDKERRFLEKTWSEREKQTLRIDQNIIQMYGSIKGIAGSSLPAVEILELPE